MSTFATELFLSALFVSTVGEAKREAEARASEAISSGNFRSVCVRIDSRDSLFTISMHSYYCLAPMRIMTAHSQCNDECAGPHREEEDCVVPKEKFEERPDGIDMPMRRPSVLRPVIFEIVDIWPPVMACSSPKWSVAWKTRTNETPFSKSNGMTPHSVGARA